MIRLENVKKVYPSKNGEVVALKNIDLHVKKGEIHGVIGYSGAGKSTLIRVVNLLEQPTEGKVFINGEELTAMTPEQLRNTRQKIGMIFQHFNLLKTATVYDNIAIPLKLLGYDKQEVDRRVKNILTSLVYRIKRIVIQPNCQGKTTCCNCASFITGTKNFIK